MDERHRAPTGSPPAERMSGDGQVPAAEPRRDVERVQRKGASRRQLLLLLAALALIAAGIVLLGRTVSVQPTRAAPTPTAVPRAAARGQIRPIAQARVGTVGGGVVTRLAVAVGQKVAGQEELARVRGVGGTEVVTAPWPGTVVQVPVQEGDTLPPGATVAVVADLSRLQVETSDVDEFLVGRLRPEQTVRLTVDALEGRQFWGRVVRVALLPERSELGDEHYPVVIALSESSPELRIGMTVRLYLED